MMPTLSTLINGTDAEEVNGTAGRIEKADSTRDC